MAFETPHDEGGIQFFWNPTSATNTTNSAYVYTVTNVVLNFTDPDADAEKISVAHLGQTAGETAKTLDLPLVGVGSSDTGRSVQFDYVGRTTIADKQTGYVTIKYGPSASRSDLLHLAGTVQSSTLTLATQDAYRGQVTIRVARS